MGKNGGAGTVLIVLVVVAVLFLFSGQIFQFIGNLTGYEGSIPSFNDLINQFLAALGLGSNNGGNASGSTSVAFVVYFTDGTKQEINMNMSYSLMPYTITFNNKAISRVNVSILGKMNGNLGPWTCNVSQHMELYKKPNTTPATSSTGNFSSSGASWAANTVKVLYSTMIEGSTLDSAVSQYGNGDYLIQVTADVSISVGGATYTAEAMRGGLDITYTNGAPQSIRPNLSIKGLS